MFENPDHERENLCQGLNVVFWEGGNFPQQLIEYLFKHLLGLEEVGVWDGFVMLGYFFKVEDVVAESHQESFANLIDSLVLEDIKDLLI